jgi:hypothetical protein
MSIVFSALSQIPQHMLTASLLVAALTSIGVFSRRTGCPRIAIVAKAKLAALDFSII